MKKTSAKSKFAFLALLIVLAMASSSCNRGIGCPNNFSVDDFTKVVKPVVELIVHQ